jgi:hypothetical protein
MFCTCMYEKTDEIMLLSDRLNWTVKIYAHTFHRSNVCQYTAEYETSQYQYQTTNTHARDNRHNKKTLHKNRQYNTIMYNQN